MTPEQEIELLKAAIRKHRDQKADDRCWLDDQELYASLGDGNLGDNYVGDQDAMLANCRRFLECRTAAGKWKTYAELESENAKLKAECSRQRSEMVPENETGQEL